MPMPKRARSQKNIVYEVASPGSDLEDRVEHEIDHERNAPAVAVREHAEDQCADRSEGERDRQGLRHLRIGDVKFLSDRGQRDDDDEKIEGVERPAEEAGGDCGALIAWSGDGRSAVAGWRSGDHIVHRAVSRRGIRPPGRASRCGRRES